MSLTVKNTLLYCCGILCALSAASAHGAEADFSGKQINVILSDRAGGGTDHLARAISPLMALHLSGKPSIIFRNIPGGAGVKAFNYFVEKVKRDGLSIVWSSSSSLDPAELRHRAVRYDPSEFIMVGHVPSPNAVMVVKKENLPRLTDKSQTPLIMGDVKGNSGNGQMLVWGPVLLDWNVRWVVGYKSHADMKLAFERGENEILVDYTGGGGSLMNQFKESGCCVFTAQLGIEKDGKLVRSPEWSDIPLFSKMIEPKLSTPMERDAYNFWRTTSGTGKWTALPPKTPKEFVDAYRHAWAETIKTDEFNKTIQKFFGPHASTQNGPEFQKDVKNIMSVSDAVLTYINQLRRKVGIPISK